MDILSAIIGGFLAAGTGWFLQTRLEAARLARTKQLFLLAITDDLTNSIELYDRIAEDWEKSRIIWFNLISEVSDSRHIFQNNKDWITLVTKEQLRKDILQYYRRSANHLLRLQNAQQRKYDIENRFDALVQDLRLQGPSLAPDAAEKTVAATMAKEFSELAGWETQISNLVNGITRYKSTAESILERLKGE